jgi:hypothetical protein
MIRKILTWSALTLGFVSSSADAMKYGSPFLLNVYAEVQGVIFWSPAEVLEFPAGNGIRENDVLAQLRTLAQKRCESARLERLGNLRFTMENCAQWFDPHLQYFANYIFRQHNNPSHEFFSEETYIYSDGYYLVDTLDAKKHPGYISFISLSLRCRDLSF